LSLSNRLTDRLSPNLGIRGGIGVWLLLPWFLAANGQPVMNAPIAGPPPAETNQWLSLTDARRISFQRNWDLLAAKSGIDAAAAQLIVSKEFPNPTASWTTYRIGTHDNGTFLGNGLWERNYDTIFSVNQLIEIAGKRQDRQVAARAGVRGAKARFFDAKRTLEQGVTKAYIAALLAAANARVLTESAGYMGQEAAIAQKQFDAGAISDADKKTLEINAEQLALQAKAVDAAALQARIAVEVLMGVNQPAGNWTPADSLDNLVELPLATPEAASRPGASRPDVLAAEADLRAGEAQLQLQKALRIPDPTFTVGEEHNPPGGGPLVDTVLFGIAFPLPLWNRNGGDIKAAQAAYVAALAERDRAESVLANYGGERSKHQFNLHPARPSGRRAGGKKHQSRPGTSRRPDAGQRPQSFRPQFCHQRPLPPLAPIGRAGVRPRLLANRTPAPRLFHQCPAGKSLRRRD
jgi:cobalt-zinc-cadmium efflux system outer membrane protein